MKRRHDMGPEPDRDTWAPLARCAGLDPAIFYPNDGHRPEGLDVCNRCPVRVECLDHALTRPERHGIWGGMSERGRDRLERRLRRGTLTWAQVAAGQLWRDWEPTEAPVTVGA